MVYADDGWSSWGDWLDSGTIATYKVKYRPFEQARAFVRTLGLRSWEDWLDFARSDKRPSDIPIKPERTYAKKGWAGMGDWLGKNGSGKPNTPVFVPLNGTLRKNPH